ncbi:MAG: 50S ribosomal protein P1 [Candidatus Micrarchaeota archaeon]|nr:50S ribosomal protein P1 [Candidatus Micrarchaeota archaeon]
MEYVYAALLLHSAKKEINKDNVSSVLKAAGVEVNSAKVEALVSALEGVNIEEALKSASAAMVAAPAAAAAAPAAGAAKSEKAEEKEEKKEEEAAAGLANLFG